MWHDAESLSNCKFAYCRDKKIEELGSPSWKGICRKRKSNGTKSRNETFLRRYLEHIRIYRESPSWETVTMRPEDERRMREYKTRVKAEGRNRRGSLRFLHFPSLPLSGSVRRRHTFLSTHIAFISLSCLTLSMSYLAFFLASNYPAFHLLF